jgi:hypothetical protein
LLLSVVSSVEESLGIPSSSGLGLHGGSVVAGIGGAPLRFVGSMSHG